MKVFVFSLIIGSFGGFLVRANNCDFLNNAFDKGDNNYSLQKRLSEKRDYVPDSCSSEDELVTSFGYDKKISKIIRRNKDRKYSENFSEIVYNLDALKIVKGIADIFGKKCSNSDITVGSYLINLCSELKNKCDISRINVFNNEKLENFAEEVRKVIPNRKMYFGDNFDFFMIQDTAKINILDNSLIIVSEIDESVFYFYKDRLFYVLEDYKISYQECVESKLKYLSENDLHKLELSNSVREQKIGDMIFKNLSLK